jgi:hypothetical protein
MRSCCKPECRRYPQRPTDLRESSGAIASLLICGALATHAEAEVRRSGRIRLFPQD